MDPKWNESESPYMSMGDNPVSLIDPMGDIVHPEDWKTFRYLAHEFFTNKTARRTLWNQMWDRKSNINVGSATGQQHEMKSVAQHYYYKLNENSNSTFGAAMVGSATWRRGTSGDPFINSHSESFNTTKNEYISKIGQGDELAQKSATGETKAASAHSYQNGNINVSFTPNTNDPTGGDKLSIYTIIGNTHVQLPGSPFNLANDPGNPAGFNNFSIPFDFGNNREHIYFKVTNNDDRKSSKPGAFDLKVNITGF